MIFFPFFARDRDKGGKVYFFNRIRATFNLVQILRMKIATLQNKYLSTLYHN